MSASTEVILSNHCAFTALSASVVAYHVRSAAAGAVVPGVLEPGGPGRADVACVNGDEVHVRTELASQALAAVVAGVEHNDREYRHR